MTDFDVTVTETVTKTYRVSADTADAATEEAYQIFDSRDDIEDDKYDLSVNSVKEV